MSERESKDQPTMDHPGSSETLVEDRVSYGKHGLHDTSQRPMHILILGAGPSGIALAIQLQAIPHVTFELFEKNPEVGGTWLENRYPGAACDVASHAYQYTFAPNPDWSQHFAPAQEIGEYFKGVATQYKLYDHIRLNAEVTSAIWDEALGIWTLAISHPAQGVTTQAVGEVFVNAGGILNAWKWPDIPGLNSFHGRSAHTASWDPSLSLEGKRIGVIGSGATGVQIVPQMQEVGAAVDVFVRSPSYVLPKVGFGIESSAYNQKYSEARKQILRDDRTVYRHFRKTIEQQMNENFSASIKGSTAQEAARNWAESEMRQAIASKDLQDKLIPSWELGCRRITPGLPYLKAVQQPNVNIVRTPISHISQDGVHTSDGTVHPLDVLVCATGFDTSFRPRFPIIGRHQIDLRELWRAHPPEAYLGLAVSGFPNYLTLLGPNCPIANGSLIPCIEWSAKYVCQVVEKMQKCQIRAFNVKRKMQKLLNEYMENVHQDLVWTGSCTSWYKDTPTGKVTAVWPGSSVHYMEVIESPRWEDFELEYCNENPYMFLGDGRSQREVKGEDLAFYIP